MKFHWLPAVIAGAALSQVGASPIRVVIAASSSEVATGQGPRFGHALADSPAAKWNIQPTNLVHTQGRPRPCAGKLIKEKAIEISNAFRHALGLPIIESATPEPGNRVHGGMVHIMPFAPTFITPANAGVQDDRHPLVIKLQDGHVRHNHRHHNHGHRLHEWGSSFGTRIHQALMALGPWEGGAVAFVLGEWFTSF